MPTHQRRHRYSARSDPEKELPTAVAEDEVAAGFPVKTSLIPTSGIMGSGPNPDDQRRPWKNYRVISGRMGWVRSVAVDPGNSWFCTGSADRTIKIWDLASGRLKLTLTGTLVKTHTHMFSTGDDKQVKCWDLETNKVIRSYHGHLSGVQCLELHPAMDGIVVTGGRDSVCRVWDIKSKIQIFTLSGHEDTVCSVFGPPMAPQLIVTGLQDKTIKIWDIRKNGKAMSDNIKKFSLPGGGFMHNMLPSQQGTIINAVAVNGDGTVLASGGDDGSLWFWDWKSGSSAVKQIRLSRCGKQTDLRRLRNHPGLSFKPP
ncbi:OLC1v1025923C1 [Oldenlandia corymbosa var. corymbosa]|uniref:OLC1v1025923C1 n=1 Tax=Oldenlandia corymbosa var. corymbosa TaxID=529605 RepID=A0AAV1C987_OLDCO|nr:OLC1v1025923C1 [Oldenlandia corymbosa var. corymbosa]